VGAAGDGDDGDSSPIAGTNLHGGKLNNSSYPEREFERYYEGEGMTESECIYPGCSQQTLLGRYAAGQREIDKDGASIVLVTYITRSVHQNIRRKYSTRAFIFLSFYNFFFLILRLK
jgi:hypothetical protein